MLIRPIVVAILIFAPLGPIAHAQTRVRACALLPASEVKRLAGQPDPLNLFEKMPAEEEPIGKGSSCNYPSLHVQIDPFDWATIDGVRAKNPAQFESIPDVGEAAYLRANKPAASVEFAELYARVGSHILTIQMDVPDGKTTASVKPGLVALAKAYAVKLR